MDNVNCLTKVSHCPRSHLLHSYISHLLVNISYYFRYPLLSVIAVVIFVHPSFISILINYFNIHSENNYLFYIRDSEQVK